MLQIRIHARGGQGGKSLAQIIAETSLGLGNFIQAFPEYGPERSGAPTRSFVRIDDKRIKTHEPIVEPNIVIVLEESLIIDGGSLEGLNKAGILMVNTERTKEEIQEKTGFKGQIYTIPATKISYSTIGMDKPGAPIAGALCRFTKLINLNALKQDMEQKFSKKGKEMIEANQKAVEIGFNSIA